MGGHAPFNHLGAAPDRQHSEIDDCQGDKREDY